MADEISEKDVLENQVQSCKENSPQQNDILKKIRKLLSNICHPYSRQYDGLDQSLYLIFYLVAIVLTFIILFVTKELSLGKENEVTSHFVQELYVDILLIFYLTPAILWTFCLFLMKNDSQILVLNNKSVSYRRPLFYSIYMFGGGFFLTDILQVAFDLRCGMVHRVRSLYLCVEAIFVFTQLLFQVLFLNASFLVRNSAKFAVVHMIGSNISVYIHLIFRKSSQEMQRSRSLNRTMISNDVVPTYCVQTDGAFRNIMDVFQPLNLQFIVITLVTLVYIFTNIRQSQNEIQRYSAATKMLRYKRNITTETSLADKSRSECTSGSSISQRNENASSSLDTGLLAGLFLGLLLLIVGQLLAKSVNWSELMIAHEICCVVIVSVMLCLNWFIAWVLYHFYPYHNWMPFTPTEGILFVATTGYYVCNTFQIVLEPLPFTDQASLSSVIKSVSKLFLGFIQTFVICKAMGHSFSNHRNNVWQKPLAQGLTFLVVCNAALGLHEIFFATTHVIDNETFFNQRTWTVITSVTHSLEVLYFLHSSTCFLEISLKYNIEIV